MCLERGFFTTRYTPESQLLGSYHPVCHLCDDRNLMVSCDMCKRWFHKDCLTEDDNWTCIDYVISFLPLMFTLYPTGWENTSFYNKTGSLIRGIERNSIEMHGIRQGIQNIAET